VKRGDRVFMDTNAMIEAHRVKAWAAIADAFQLWTVAECLVEAASGDRLHQGYVPVDVENWAKWWDCVRPGGGHSPRSG